MHHRSVLGTCLAIGLLSFAASAWAQESTTQNSEYLHQANSGVFELTPEIISVGTSYDVKDSPSHTHVSTLSSVLGASGEYGINSILSVGLQLGYGSATTTVTCDFPYLCSGNSAEGMTDPGLVVKARFDIGAATLKVGLTGSTSTENKKIKNTYGDSNEASGGTTITPFVGVELPMGPGTLGFKLSYDAYKGDRSVDDSSGSAPTSYKLTGGQETSVSAFYEYNYRMFTFGGALGYNSQNASATNSDGASTDNGDYASSYYLQVYVPMHFTPNITLLPIAELVEYSEQGLDISGFALGVAGRFSF